MGFMRFGMPREKGFPAVLLMGGSFYDARSFDEPARERISVGFGHVGSKTVLFVFRKPFGRWQSSSVGLVWDNKLGALRSKELAFRCFGRLSWYGTAMVLS